VLENEVTQDESTYVIDAENAAEMARLMTLARLMTEDMGTLFPVHLDLTTVHDVLDIACGPGQWVIDVAKSYPNMQVTGIDISNLMIAYAQTQTQEIPNAHFHIMDARQALDFPTQHFDYIQARHISAFMLTTAWPQLLQECQRVLQPGGTLCLIEGENCGISNCASLERYNALLAEAMRQSGYCFARAGNMGATTPMLPRLLREQGFQNIRQQAYALNFSAGERANKGWYANYRTALKLLQPFLVQSGVTTQPEMDVLYERTMEEMQSSDFCALFFYYAVTGEKRSE
jgi:ubiquinone/menaquinone biosynthesis C-methylase UbiE